jgi:NAD-dependent SIR2 family protein deacetylase
MDFFVQELEDKKEMGQKIDHIKNNFMEKKTDYYKRNKMIKDNNKKFIEITKNIDDLNSKKNIMNT